MERVENQGSEIENQSSNHYGEEVWSRGRLGQAMCRNRARCDTRGGMRSDVTIDQSNDEKLRLFSVCIPVNQPQKTVDRFLNFQVGVMRPKCFY
jgi:hypothetical protein